MELTLFQRLFPQRALAREIARAQIAAVKTRSARYYEGGQSSPYRPKGLGDTPQGSPQGATQEGAEAMRQYARDLDENNDIAISILDTLVNNVVGSGVPMRPMIKNADGSLNTQANDQMRRILADWSKRPTADKGQSFAQAQRLLCRSWLRDGEVLIQKLGGNIAGFEHGSALPYSLEMLEADYLPYVLNTSTPSLIIQGVQVTPYYEPIAYHLSKKHPGDSWQSWTGVWTSESDYRRIDASRMIHLKFTRRINQVRGVSILHGVIRSIEDLGDYVQSERIAARVAAAFTGYVKKSPDSQTVINAETGDRDMEMSPGMIFDNLLPGEEIGTIDSNRPNTGMNDFVYGQTRRIAGGTMTNASTISRNYEGSYSSQRQSMVEAKPNYDILRDYFVNQFIRPIYEDLVDYAVMTGALRVPRSVKRDTLHDMVAPNVAMPWIDPKKEVEADVLRITNNLASRSQIITERGGDPEAVAKQIENDEELFPEVQINDMDTETTGRPSDEVAEDTETENAEA